MATIEKVTNMDVENRLDPTRQELVHAYGGLKVALHLIHPLISAKPLHESGQTLLITTRDKKDTDPDYFEPHNFLVKLRLAALPLLQDLWNAPWLVPAPLPVTRSVVQAVMELTSGENEEPKGDGGGEVIIGGPSHGAPVARPTGPDENRIRQLTDMGFPRSAAERALIRTHNNVNAATELLLSHPFYLPPAEFADPPSDAEPSEEAAPSNEDGTSASNSEEEMQAEEPTSEPVPLAEPPVAPVESKSSEQWRKDLNDAREPLMAGTPKQALRLADEHPTLIFDVYNAFTRPSDGLQEQSVRHLVEDIKAFSPFAHDVQEEPLAMRCRLLALVLVDAPSPLTQDIGSNLMDSLLALLLSNPLSADAHPSIPKWLAAHLLVTEALLIIGEQPRSITLPKEGQPIVAESIALGPLFPEARTIIFDFCFRLLAMPDLPRDDLLSVLRLFVLLTRDHKVACQFVRRDGITLLFKHLKSSNVSGSQSYIALILRHVIEDPSVLQHVMKQEIKRFFAQPRTRIVDVGVFVQVSQSLCKLQHPYASIHHLTLKDDAASMDVNSTERKEEADGSDMQVDISSASPASTEAMENVVHFLVSELMKASKASSDATASSLTSSGKPRDLSTSVDMDAPTTSAKGPNDSIDTTKDIDRHFYSCFLMQCLTELLFSYDSCKVAFLSYSPKKRSQQTPAKEGAKHRTAALQFLLSDLISFGTISQTDPDLRNRHLLCSWAMSVVVALCVDSSSASEAKDVSPDLVSVRKFVLEAVSRAIKDLPPSESLDSRYGRLFALSDLCHRLLTVRFNTAGRKPQDETPTHIAKVMLEKNFVSTLTNALAEVDLNFPNVRSLVAAILRPLEHLTKIAIKMSRASDKSKDSAEGKANSVGSLASEEEEDDGEDMEDAGREETPDLYRNSSLGMYGGEMEDVHYSPENETGEDEEDEDEDVEMDFGEETGSDDTSNTDEEEEDALEGVGRESEEGWQDEDEEYEEDDLVENNEEEDDEDGDDNEGEEEGDGEILWQDIHADGNIADAAGEDQDEEDEGNGKLAV
jgi:E3 ubiquitin-protein ligase HUWE1